VKEASSYSAAFVYRTLLSATLFQELATGMASHSNKAPGINCSGGNSRRGAPPPRSEPVQVVPWLAGN